ncbi:Mu transposase C-terminal domain-containing protein [Cytobacillus oceanisediminis]|uniref:Integrase catalytic domain-containing protein n=1 Tax=Cytobacillus oceanisediminis TaxID=665099 RepID=A0ABX3CM45_9BACI|nr:Mu transposase C-terminal domain-containing protein [Cytobacillus oceanisediminis]OHX42884.1 hypothetical protein BBV17_26565 [Cytobacillus oceanisediminis]
MGGDLCTILNITEFKVTILNEGNILELPHEAFTKLLNNGTIKGFNEEEQPENASPSELEEANRKYNILISALNGESLEELNVKPRTFRDWKKKFREAEIKLGNGYVGLLPARHNQGNRSRKLRPEVITLMEEYIQDKYEDVRNPKAYSVYKKFEEACKCMGFEAPSFVTFWSEIKKRPIHDQIRKRRGPKAAYSTEKFYYELNLSAPRHGDYPFNICHIDHTLLDIELVCSETNKNLGRPWLTILMDAYSRRILAFYLTFDEPSYRSCMMVIRECVRRHSRFPKVIVVDGGKEFHSVYFDTLVATYNGRKEKRPGGKPKFGSVCERLFGTTNTMFIDNLLGNTQVMKNIREVTMDFNPKNKAIWTLESFYEILHQWCYEVYDQYAHSSLGDSPRNTFINRLYKTGKRKHTMIKYDLTFRMLTLPSTRKKTAIVQPGRGVRINNINYWSDFLEHPEIERKSVHVRYDPYNIGYAYAYVNKNWIKLQSEYIYVFENRTEKEIKLATQELRKRMKITGEQKEISGNLIVNFLESIEAKEVLELQRLRDQALNNVFQVIEGGQTNNPRPKKFVSKNKTSTNLSIVDQENKKGEPVPANKNCNEKKTKFVVYEEFY